MGGRDDFEFWLAFEDELTTELQLQRPDLFFVHAGAVEKAGKAALLAAPSGTGKSTLTLALLHAGFRYLTDELAPVDVNNLTVAPYPRALCLKNAPPRPFVLPSATIHANKTLHIPVPALPAAALSDPVPLAALFFLHRSATPPPSSDSCVLEIGKAEAAALLYANALNPLAHAGHGLDAAIQIAQSVPCYQLDCADLMRVGPVISDLLEPRLSD
jgi:hypothetical protein